MSKGYYYKNDSFRGPGTTIPSFKLEIRAASEEENKIATLEHIVSKLLIENQRLKKRLVYVDSTRFETSDKNIASISKLDDSLQLFRCGVNLPKL
jgi:hypothetical protein